MKPKCIVIGPYGGHALEDELSKSYEIARRQAEQQKPLVPPKTKAPKAQRQAKPASRRPRARESEVAS